MRNIQLLTGLLCVVCTSVHSPLRAQEVPANEEARVKRDMHDMMNITQAMLKFANKNDGNLPSSLGQTLPFIQDWTSWKEGERQDATPAEKARLFISSADESRVQLPEKITAEWIDQNASYIYLAKPGAKLSDYPDESRVVILHGKNGDGYTVDREPTGRTVVYPLSTLNMRAFSVPRDRLESFLRDGVPE